MKKVLLMLTCLLITNLTWAQVEFSQGGTVIHTGTSSTPGAFRANYDFGTVATGATKDVTFTLTNQATTQDFTISPTGNSVTGPYTFITVPSGVIGSSNGTSTFTVRYAPTATSGSAGELKFTGNYLNQASYIITLGGSANTAPAIAGTTGNQAVNDNSTTNPFSVVTVSDAESDNVSATITLDAAAKGALSGIGLSDDGGGVYSIASTSASDLQTKLQALIFTPTTNRSATSETTTFTLAVNDGTDTSSDNTTTVISSAVAPVLNSITVSGSPASNATSVNFTITFSESVSGVDVNDFSLDGSGVTGSISNISGSGANYTVTVSSLAGNGTVSIDLNASSTAIVDVGGKAISGGFTNGANHPVVIVTSASLDVTVYLEGAYNGTGLNNAINSSIPLIQPYATNGHSGGSATSIPANAVDWVLIELREAGSAATALASTKVGSASGFLMNDGTVKAPDGTSNLTVSLSGNTGADFFVVIYHRNHLPIMSASAISESGGNYIIDFTSASANTYQNTMALTSLAGGKFGMVAGDSNGDGDVDAADLTAWRGQNGTPFVYNTTNGDFNLDGVINAIDRNAFQQKNVSKVSQVPTT